MQKKERKKNCLVVLHRDELQYVQVSLSSETMFKSFFFELFFKKGPLPSIAKGNNEKELFFSSLHTEKARELVHYSAHSSSLKQNSYVKEVHIINLLVSKI